MKTEEEIRQIREELIEEVRQVTDIRDKITGKKMIDLLSYILDELEEDEEC